jgi:hypothetical protein
MATGAAAAHHSRPGQGERREPCAGDSAASGSGRRHGGNDDDDDSGELRHVRRIRRPRGHSQQRVELTFNGVGRGRRLHQAPRADDGFEWFGGTMDATHLIAIDGTDDGYDWQWGTRNRAQFVIVRVASQFAPSLGQQGDKGIEADNNEFNLTRRLLRYRTAIVQLTLVGDKRLDRRSRGRPSA